MSEALTSALAILDYGCDEGDFDKEAQAVRDLQQEVDRYRKALERILANLTESGAWDCEAARWAQEARDA